MFLYNVCHLADVIFLRIIIFTSSFGESEFIILKITSMKPSEIYAIVEKLPKEQRKAITLLIEMTIDQERTENLKEFDLINSQSESMIEIAFEKNNNELEIIKTKYDNLNTKYNVLIGAIGLIGAMISILSFLK